MARGSAPFDFEVWFWDYAMSPDAVRVLDGYCRRYGLSRHDRDDVRSEWMLRVTATLRRSGLPSRIRDADQARPYVLLAARRTALDLGCRGVAQKESARDFGTEVQLHPAVMAEHENAPEIEPGEWCDGARSVITRRFRAGEVECSGCTSPAVVQYALAVVAAICEDAEHEGGPEREPRSISGGSTVFARRLYEVIELVHPEKFEVDDQGRVAPRTRAYKNRCEPCVVDLLTEAADEVRSHTGGGDLAHSPGATGPE